MPCDYLNADEGISRDAELSKVACFLEELNGKQWWDDSRSDYSHPIVDHRSSIFNTEKKIAELCRRLQSVDVTKYSLELQMWWRDHQIADRQRVESEIQMKKSQEEKKKALKKLTPYERKLLKVKV